MRIVILTFVASLLYLSVSAQNEKYLESMKTNIEQYSNANDVNTFQMLSGKFEGIARVESENWIPAYYSIQSLLEAAIKEEDLDQKDLILDKVQILLDKYSEKFPKETEIMVLQAYSYQIRMSIDNMKTMIYGPKATKLLQNAVELNPKNPRCQYLLGMNIYYTPKMFGGGAEKALEHLQKAKELYESVVIDIPFYPEWGEEDNSELLKSCESALAQ